MEPHILARCVLRVILSSTPRLLGPRAYCCVPKSGGCKRNPSTLVSEAGIDMLGPILHGRSKRAC